MPIRGEAIVDLSDGSRLTLAVNFATLARAAAATSIPAQDLFGVLQDASDPRQMLTLLAMLEQALRRHHPKLSEDAIGDLMLDDGDAIGAALKQAVEGAFGEAEQVDTGANPPKRGTGTRSRASGPKQAKTRGSSGTKRRAVS